MLILIALQTAVAADNDNDGFDEAVDCDDTQPVSHQVEEWFPDCDGDGVFNQFSVSHCGPPDAVDTICASAQLPVGGYRSVDCPPNPSGSDPICTEAEVGVSNANEFDDGSLGSIPGEDCDDTNFTLSLPGDWYYDCDDDDAFVDPPINSCGQPPAPCPNPRFTLNPGVIGDCDDDEPVSSEVVDWYPDCDGDGVFNTGFVAHCGPPDAVDTICAFAQLPVGGYRSADCPPNPSGSDPVCTEADVGAENANEFDDGSLGSIPGQDCDDTNFTIALSGDWFHDCDDDGFDAPETGGIPSCGQPAFTPNECLALGETQPRWTLNPSQTLDCNDESALQNPAVTWYSDLDGDGYGDPATGKPCRPVDEINDVTNGDDCDDDPSGCGELCTPTTAGCKTTTAMATAIHRRSSGAFPATARSTAWASTATSASAATASTRAPSPALAASYSRLSRSTPRPTKASRTASTRTATRRSSVSATGTRTARPRLRPTSSRRPS